MREYFDKELSLLSDQLIEMGSFVEQAIGNTIDMILSGDTGKLTRSREYESKINEAEKNIQNHCIRLLLHQAPVAYDLRYVSAALKMITDLERIGDQAIDIAEMTGYIKNRTGIFNMTHITDMAKQSANMVTEAINAFVKRDLQLAKSVSSMDDIIDNLCEKVREETVEIICQDKELGSQAIDIVMIAKYLERIGDHAVNVAEWVAFSLTGSCELNNK